MLTEERVALAGHLWPCYFRRSGTGCRCCHLTVGYGTTGGVGGAAALEKAVYELEWRLEEGRARS